MKNNHKIKAVGGILQIHRDMNKVINPDIIRESFKETGMYNPTTRSYDLEKIISKHDVKRSFDEKILLIELIPKLSKMMSKYGAQ